MAVNPVPSSLTAARAMLESKPGGLLLKVSGNWRLGEAVPSWNSTVAGEKAPRIQVIAEDLGQWDSSLVLFLARGSRWCGQQGVELNFEQLTPTLRTMVLQAGGIKPPLAPVRTWSPKTLLVAVGTGVNGHLRQGADIVRFIGECLLSFLSVVRKPARFRWKDCLAEMQQCGAGALPIVSLISFLVGVIMAFQSAVQLQQFGADIFVADLVGLVVVREMGPMMAAVVLTGRTGAAFAAQLGNMKVGEEVDALETLGISPVDFLVVPRLVALGLMMPLLAIYADVLGVLGGLFVSTTMMDIPAATYWRETQGILTLTDISSGLIKSVWFGLLVGLAGCLRGLQCGRGSGGVGLATTSAVVTGILLVIVADAIFAVIFNRLGI